MLLPRSEQDVLQDLISLALVALLVVLIRHRNVFSVIFLWYL